MALATFAGGCFWCMVKPFDQQEGIESVISGYTGGHTENPTYEEVCSETTGHFEAVQITFDPAIYSYEKLVDLYWTLIDPTDAGGQFYDRGQSYMTAIFYHDEDQRNKAEASKRHYKNQVNLKLQSLYKFYQQQRFTQQKLIINIITKRIQHITSAIQLAQDELHSNNSIGGQNHEQRRKVENINTDAISCHARAWDRATIPKRI